jgi:hypothetical protein
MRYNEKINFDQLLEKYDANELQVITQFLQDVSRGSWKNMKPSLDDSKTVDPRREG